MNVAFLQQFRIVMMTCGRVEHWVVRTDCKRAVRTGTDIKDVTLRTVVWNIHLLCGCSCIYT